MLDVYITVDVEIWCDDWSRIDEQFPEAFRRYVYGPTPKGEYGLPFQLRLLKEHGLRACFFVEPLFSLRFGAHWLREIVDLIQSAGQEVQLHLHPEWVDEISPPPVPIADGKRPLLRQYPLADQITLIGLGKRLLEEAGVAQVKAFRAGSFGLDANTLEALSCNGLFIDASYNATMYGAESGIAKGTNLCAPVVIGGLLELPMTIYRDGMGGQRHLQLGSSSWPEIERLLWQAAESDAGSLMMLSHNFELLNQARNAPDRVVVGRMERLISFLARHRDQFSTPRLCEAPAAPVAKAVQLAVPRWLTLRRAAEQFGRRRFG